MIQDQSGKGDGMLVLALLRDANKAILKRLVDAYGLIFKPRFLDQVRPFAHTRDLLAHAAAAG